jgi:MFS family permease
LKHLKYFFSNKDTLAIGSAFVLLGFLFGNWATMIPHVKYTHNLNDGLLGLILLSMPLGCLLFNFFAAICAQKWGKRAMTVVGMALLSISYAIPLSGVKIWLVPLGLFFAGMCVSLLNISMNMVATEMESQNKVHIMSTCHGMFSAGLMVGSLMRSITLPFCDAPIHMFSMCSLMLILTLIVSRKILTLEIHETKDGNTPSDKLTFSWPTGALWIMVLISLCTNVTEGTMADWSTLYMADIVHTSPNYIGWGLSAYSGMMAFGRFMGDAWIPKYGPNKVLAGGAIAATFGFLLAIILPYSLTSIIGFGLVGIGVSLGSPILYAAAARYSEIPNGGGLAIMNTFSMVGFLVGPVIIGYISNLSNLQYSFALVASLCVIWWYYGRFVKLL